MQMSKQKNKEGTKLILCEVLGIIKQEQTCPENNKIRPGHKDCFTLIGKGGLNRHFRNPGIAKKMIGLTHAKTFGRFDNVFKGPT